MRPLLVTVLALTVTGGCGWLALRYRAAEHAAYEELRRWNARTQQNLTQKKELESRIATARSTNASRQTPNPSPPHTPAIAQIAPPRTPVAHPLSVLQKDAEVLALGLAVRRTEVRATYDPFFRQIGLIAEQVSRFTENIMKREGARADLHAARLERGLSEEDPAIRKLREQIDEQYRAAQQTLLGSSGMAQLEEYEPTLQVRKIIAGIAGSAVVAGVPWSPAQGEAIVRLALVVAPVESRTGGSVNPGEIDWDHVDEQARRILTPEQFELFRNTQPHAGGAGSRFQWRLNRSIDKAIAAEMKSLAPPE